MSGGNSRGCFRPLVVALAVALAGGCVSETKQPPVRVLTPEPRPRQVAAGETAVPNEATDPCANRLHELSGPLLGYYALNKRLPEKLEELAPLLDTGAEFNADCPVAGRPYVYVPRGLQAQGQERLLVLYDPTPAHAGLRWGVFIAPPRGGQLPSTYVLLMSEEVFRSFVK